MALNQREKRKDPVKSWCVTFKILELAILDFKKKKTPKRLTILLEEGSTEEHGLCHKADLGSRSSSATNSLCTFGLS